MVLGHRGIIFHTLNLSTSWGGKKRRYLSLLPLGTIIRLAPRTDMQIKNYYTKREPVTCTAYAYKHVGYNDGV